MKQNAPFEKTALAITRWLGSPHSIFLHTMLFMGAFFAVIINLVAWDEMLLMLTTVVSLEAIYLSLFIQMTVNLTTESLQEVEQNLDEIQEDVGEIQVDVDEIQKDVDEIQGDVDELQEDVEEMSEEEDAGVAAEAVQQKTLADIQADLRKLMQDIDRLQQSK